MPASHPMQQPKPTVTAMELWSEAHRTTSQVYVRRRKSCSWQYSCLTCAAEPVASRAGHEPAYSWWYLTRSCCGTKQKCSVLWSVVLMHTPRQFPDKRLSETVCRSLTFARQRDWPAKTAASTVLVLQQWRHPSLRSQQQCWCWRLLA